ncbi:hypothetical protein OG21DRAFT_1511151 [Imleria badia]|nr:hypothetical protein OG21DRAFT_1511151 [Imleria badia]
MESPASPAIDPIVIIVVPGDQPPQPMPFVYHASEEKHDLPSAEPLAREVARLSSSSRSTLGGDRSRSRSTLPGMMHSSSPPMSNKQTKARMWHEALQRKRAGAKMMLAAQKVIEEVEEEIGLSVSKATINRLRSRFYNAGDCGDPTAEAYIMTISAVGVEQGVGMSKSTSGDRDSNQVFTRCPPQSH